MPFNNSRSARSTSRSTRAPQTARTTRAARAASSGRIASRSDEQQFSHNSQQSAYRAAYTPSSKNPYARNARQKATPANPYSRTNPAYSARASKKMSRGKKIALGIVSVLLVALLGCGTAFALFINSVNSKLTAGKTEEELEAIGDVLAPATSFSEPFYMLLIGSDRRANDESMGARSDTNIVVRVDPANSLVTMISIPRDTQIQIDGYGTDKFNATYNYGGTAAVITEASQLCGVDISHYAEVNFEELVQLVDVIGGVEVDVPELIDDPDAGDYIIQPGLQTLDGERALEFARCRSYVDGDFTRTSNQRLLIEALINKVLSMSITQLPDVIQNAAQCVTTDLSVSDIFGLATQFRDTGDLTIYSAMVPSTTGYVGGISYVFTDTYALNQMMKIVADGGDPNTVQTSAAIGSSLNANTETY